MRKAIIFDCDNTLWSGVIGEDMIVPDIQLQSDIRFYANHGVIIGLCSKNNEDDVLEELPHLIDYISVQRINWNDKVSNLKEIAQELNIGLDSIVFVDDSPFEINLVRDQLPEVLAIYPDELTKTVSKHFDLTGNFTKTKQYKEQYQRVKASSEFTNIDDYLASLDMVLSIKINDENSIDRIAELTQKTNQFNLTTLRLTSQQVRELMNWITIYTLSVRDRFGDSGLTGVCMVNNNIITNFLLSCRILGRGIEFAFMDWIVKHHGSNLTGRYAASEKNGQTADFYDKCGFKSINENTYLLKEYTPKAKNHFRYE